MSRIAHEYVCQQCGKRSNRWMGRCPECEAWSSFVEEAPRQAPVGPPARSHGAAARPAPITQVSADAERRRSTGIGELDRVLGGGMVEGGLMLVGGDPGIGKSTLMLQAAHRIALGAAAEGRPALYITGEESARQVRMRAERLGALCDGLLVVAETDASAMCAAIIETSPVAVIVDSIQTARDPDLESATGTVSQVRQCAARFSEVARAGGPPIFLVGHVTKEGSLAGPKVLEHMVDTVLAFEGDRQQAYRVLRATKNRFGSTDEIGLFEMREDGLAEVENPSAALLAERSAGASGSAIAATIEGTRPILVEIQALACRSYLPSPRRNANGIDFNRFTMLLAVLEKRIGLRLGEQDVFLNVAGGVRIMEPAADLAVTMAIASSFRDQAVDPETVLVGEVGLGGEIRAVPNLDRRIREAARLGFRRVIAPRGAAAQDTVSVVVANDLAQAMQRCLVPLEAK